MSWRPLFDQLRDAMESMEMALDLRDVPLEDALAVGDESLTPAPAIKMRLELKGGNLGIGIGFPPGEGEDDSWEWRVLVENYNGKVVCHVWETLESLGNDATHSIVIER